MLRMTPIALALGIGWEIFPLVAIAQSNHQDTQDAVQLREVSITSTRSQRKVDDIPNTVTVIPRQQMETQGARDLKDLLAEEVDVSVRAAPARFTAAGAATGRAGVEGINIRGLEGNQVLMLVDGIRVPNSFSFAAFATGRGDYVEVDGLKSAEVLRGPASTQFGSDGLAGAVSFRTLDPSDLLKADRNAAGFAGSGYAGVDRSWTHTAAVAGRHGRWQGLLLGSRRQGGETQNQGEDFSLNVDRTASNPADYRNGYLLGKVLLDLDANHQLGFTFETQRRRQDTEVYSARAKPPLSATGTLDLDAHDRMERDRLSFEHRFKDVNAEWVQKAETKLYWQDARIQQNAVEDRNTAVDRTRDNTYSTQILGFSSVLESNFTGWLNQRVTYGLDWSQSKTEGIRSGTVPPFGETFPTKAFPDTTFAQTGAFVQSEVEAGAFSVIPGLRLDHYKLSPSLSGYTGGNAVTLSDHALTPRLGVVWRLAPALAPYAQWSKGFRAPTPDQVNNGFANLASGYTSVGNPDLQAERANSLEVGVRGKLDAMRYTLTAFENRYDNFIGQQAVSGAGTPANPTVFQYINLSNARIRGVEARTAWTLSKHWSAHAGLAYARGDSKADGVSQPIDTVNPLKAVLGVRYDEGMWGAWATLTHHQGKSASRVGTVTSATGGQTAQFTPGASTVLNLGSSWKPMPQLTLNAQVQNLFDTTYWRWSDVRGLASNSTVKDAYTAPGRTFNVSVRYDF